MSRETSAFIIPICPSTDKVLMCQNKNEKWAFFGGRESKRDLDTPMITALREFKEETDLSLCNVNHNVNFIDRDDQQICVFDAELYETAVIKIGKEHIGYEWYNPYHIKDLKLSKRGKSIYKYAIELDLRK